MGVPEDSPSFPYGSEAAWKVFTGKESAINSFKVSISETCHLEYITLPSQDHRGQFTKERFWGMYTFGQRNLVVTDVELGKLITIKDADHFVDRSTGLYVRLLKFIHRAPFGLPYTELKEEADKIFGMFLSNMTGSRVSKY